MSVNGGRPVRVNLGIYDLTGRLIRTLVDEPQNAGYYQVSWDGKDNAGEKISSGIYLYRIEVGTYTSVKKMILMR